MAIYHLRLKVISRGQSQGGGRKSVVAAAAYRSGEPLYDVAQGRTYAYDKPDVVHTEILVPEVSAVADWVLDRAALWNMVEKSEKRADAQLAREIEISLPRELTREQQIDLVRRFIREHFVNKGMVADFAIHNPAAVDGQEQPHAHVLFTMRRLDPTSPTGFSKTKERDWNEREDIARDVAEARKRYNNTGLAADLDALEAVEATRNVNIWRREWAEAANSALAAVGSEARIDHRTLEKQGIERVAEISLGIARHIEKAYDYLKERVTQWVGIKKRASLYEDVKHMQSRDPQKLTEFILNLHDMAESFAAQFRKPPPLDKPPPEVNLDR